MEKLAARLKALFRHLLQDLDSYVVIATAIAIGLAFVAAADVRLSDYLPTITIALLALISLSLVRTRYRLQPAKSLPVSPTDVLAWRDSVAEIEDLINASDEVWIWGAALTEYIPILSATLRRGVSRGLKAKVMLIKPNSAALRMLAFRAVSPPSNTYNGSAARYLKKLDDMAQSLNRKLLRIIENSTRRNIGRWLRGRNQETC